MGLTYIYLKLLYICLHKKDKSMLMQKEELNDICNMNYGRNMNKNKDSYHRILE